MKKEEKKKTATTTIKDSIKKKIVKEFGSLSHGREINPVG
jgi:hypothetical protein